MSKYLGGATVSSDGFHNLSESAQKELIKCGAKPINFERPGAMKMMLETIFRQFIESGAPPHMLIRLANEAIEEASELLISMKEAKREHEKSCPCCRRLDDDVKDLLN